MQTSIAGTCTSVRVLHVHISSPLLLSVNLSFKRNCNIYELSFYLRTTIIVSQHHWPSAFGFSSPSRLPVFCVSAKSGLGISIASPSFAYMMPPSLATGFKICQIVSNIHLTRSGLSGLPRDRVGSSLHSVHPLLPRTSLPRGSPAHPFSSQALLGSRILSSLQASPPR